MARFAFLDHPLPLAFAHRGGAGDAPENTLPAFEAAVRLGFRYLETDVHVTADGALVAFHDDRLERVTDRAGRVRELPWSELRRARVGGREPIPLLEDVLGSFPAARVNIDPKHDDAVAPLAAAIRRTNALERVCVGSFSDRRLRRVRAMLGPRLCTALGPAGIGALVLTGRAPWRGPRRAGCAQVPPRVGRRRLVDGSFVRRAHHLGLQVHVWTVDDPDEMHRLLDLGVDGLMTDRPAVLAGVLRARGQWATT